MAHRFLHIKPAFWQYLPREPVTQPEWSHEIMRDYWAIKE